MTGRPPGPRLLATRRAWSAIVGALLVGCGVTATDGDADMLLLAASDLALALEEILPAFEARTGERVGVVLGSTGNLAAQIRHGAPADLFFSADESFMDALIESGHIEPASRRVYAVGRVALVVPPGHEALASPRSLADPALGLVALANPEHAPYGRAAREVLEALGLWDRLEGRLVLGEHVAHALQFVRTGNADAGLVALSLLRAADGTVPHSLVDAALHAPLRQVAGRPTGRPRPEAADEFVDFVLSAEGQRILARYGFEPPDGVGPPQPGGRP